jgi:DNA-binding IclR family transcriptional regulator
LDSSGSIEDAVMRVFQLLPHAWLSSGFFVRHVGLERWTAQGLLAELADRGWLERKGKTSGTRYRLPARLADPRRQPAEVPNDDE